VRQERPVISDEHPAPDELLHADVKKLRSIPAGGGWRCLGRAQGIGQVHTSFVSVADLAALLAPPQDPSWPRRIGTFGMVGRGLPHVLPHRRPRALT
jgi:hypothetical protein